MILEQLTRMRGCYLIVHMLGWLLTNSGRPWTIDAHMLITLIDYYGEQLGRKHFPQPTANQPFSPMANCSAIIHRHGWMLGSSQLSRPIVGQHFIATVDYWATTHHHNQLLGPKLIPTADCEGMIQLDKSMEAQRVQDMNVSLVISYELPIIITLDTYITQPHVTLAPFHILH